MGKILKINTLGSKGIDLVATPIDSADDSLLNAQNATVRPVQGQYGITKRDGMAKINSVAAAGTLLQISNIPLYTPASASTCTLNLTNGWKAGAWSHDLGLFAIVANSGTGNRVATSPDGVTWTSRVSAADEDWADIICVDSITNSFVAVGGDDLTATSQVMTSADGITWTSRTAGADREWSSIAWSADLTLFAAVAFDSSAGAVGQVMTSPDGVTWTSRDASAARAWRSVCWADGPNLFVAVAAQAGVFTNVMTSPDGITWTTRTPGISSNWNGVVWSDELDLIVATGIKSTGNPAVMTSTDGINWTEQNTDALTGGVSTGLWKVAWSPERRLFLAGYNSNTTDSLAAISSDGITWRNVTLNCGGTNQNNPVWSSTLEKFLVIGQVGFTSVRALELFS